MRYVYIFGHKKPDTDTVTSAIALSYLKNKIGILSKPMILGEINSETKFVLDYFNIDTPEYLDDVKLQIKDLNYYKECYVNENSSIYSVYNYMSDRNITGVPLVDDNNVFKGLLTSKIISSELIKGHFNKLKTSYKNIIDVLSGEEILKFDDEIIGNVLVTAGNGFNIDSSIVISENVESLIQNKKVKLLILVENASISSEQLLIAKENKINIIKTKYDTFNTARLIGFSNYAKNMITNVRTVNFNENDYYDELKEKSSRLGYNNYPIVNNAGICLGLLRITDIKEKNKKQVILVDHNEESQSVEGLNEAEILEIIDHHRLATITTNMPINFRNMTVGSTNTILYSVYNENNVDIPCDIAGIMLSGIISDTLKFTSPTTTEYDKYVASQLSKIAHVDIDKFSDEMFRAGTNLEGKSLEEIIQGDMKIYDVENKKIAISQLITMNSSAILERKQDYIDSLDEMKKNKEFSLFVLCVTDILKGGSYIFFDSTPSSKEIVSNAFDVKDIEEGYFFYKCLSRKKQLVPCIMNVIN